MKKTLFYSLVLLVFFTQCAMQKNTDFINREIKTDNDLVKTTTWLRAFDSNSSMLGTGYFYCNTVKNKTYIIT